MWLQCHYIITGIKWQSIIFFSDYAFVTHVFQNVPSHAQEVPHTVHTSPALSSQQPPASLKFRWSEQISGLFFTRIYYKYLDICIFLTDIFYPFAPFIYTKQSFSHLEGIFSKTPFKVESF